MDLSRTFKKASAWLIFFSLVLFSISAHAADVTLNWQTVAGSGLTYKVYYRQAHQSYDYNSPAWSGTNPPATITGLQDYTVYYFVVRSEDSLGNQSGDSNEALYAPPPNRAPTASAGGNRSVDENSTVILNGTGSSDPENDMNSYQWTQLGGPGVTINNSNSASASFSAPAVGPGGSVLTFRLRVVDGGGLTATDTCTIAVNDTDTYSGTDSDGDGMPDSWEQANGLDPYSNDAGADPDNDGISNLDEYLTGGEPFVASANTRPATPTLETPSHGQDRVSATPRLRAGAFIDPDNRSRHTRSQWQIWCPGTSEDSCVFDITHTNFLTELMVPRYVLDEGHTYYWRVKYYDDSGAASQWSQTNTFTTESHVTDWTPDGIPSHQQADDTVDIDGDNRPDNTQLDIIKVVNTVVGDGQMGVSVRDAAAVRNIDYVESIDPVDIDDSQNRPGSMPKGLLGFRLEVDEGATVDITVYLSEAVPAGARWYKYDSVNGWDDYTHNAAFSADGKAVTLQLTDGGEGDADGIANGVIIDPSGPVYSSVGDTLSTVTGGSSSGGGCFINSAQTGFMQPQINSLMAFLIAMLLLSALIGSLVVFMVHKKEQQS